MPFTSGTTHRTNFSEEIRCLPPMQLLFVQYADYKRETEKGEREKETERDNLFFIIIIIFIKLELNNIVHRMKKVKNTI